ncbi:hypothetical protein GCM10012287_15630 [Streptomyces daqingensis]|uniref:Uncharacterized protein n=1 Tax=Streptomyces daqingensis TaxID=1472640 RepID=A0ABQ2M2J9_9ACTN|nr:hypothetical protein GCM10012287_15630 [Streptomyces daqingensis]
MLGHRDEERTRGDPPGLEVHTRGDLRLRVALKHSVVVSGKQFAQFHRGPFGVWCGARPATGGRLVYDGAGPGGAETRVGGVCSAGDAHVGGTPWGRAFREQKFGTSVGEGADRPRWVVHVPALRTGTSASRGRAGPYSRSWVLRRCRPRR